MNYRTFLDQLFSTDYFKPLEDQPPPIMYRRVDSRIRLYVVVGENASGKSFFRKLVEAVGGHNKLEVISLSMQRRTEPDFSRALIFGEADYKSTGEVSSSTISKAIATSIGRKTEHILFWDEPDIGLSDSWAACAGREIGAFAKALPLKCRAAFVVTHSKPLIQGILSHGFKPGYIHFGDSSGEGPLTLKDYMTQPLKEYTSLEALRIESLARFRAIERVIQSSRRKSND